MLLGSSFFVIWKDPEQLLVDFVKGKGPSVYEGQHHGTHANSEQAGAIANNPNCKSTLMQQSSRARPTMLLFGA
jgi:hypothetical protein